MIDKKVQKALQSVGFHSKGKSKSRALESAKDNLPRKTVTNKMHHKIMREQGTEKYNHR